MFDILIFGGTTEGREIAEFCCANGIKVTVSVTTEYGAELLPKSRLLNILTGKLGINQIKTLIIDNCFKTVIDATHPYAETATKNIRSACRKTGVKYYRLLRDKTSEVSGKCVSDMNELIEYLKSTKGVILSTLGSKELRKLTELPDYYNRLWIRILPAENISGYCKELGFCESQIIFGKGPFSKEQNISHIKKSGAGLLITKESGKAGGYSEKISAAKECGIETVTLTRPDECGYSQEEIEKIILKEEYGKT